MHQEGWEPTLSDSELEVISLRKEVLSLTAKIEERRALHAKVVRGMLDYIKNVNNKIFAASQELSELILPGCTTPDNSYRSIDGSWVKMEREYKPSVFWAQFKKENGK